MLFMRRVVKLAIIQAYKRGDNFKEVITDSCEGKLAATLTRRARVGFSEHNTTNLTCVSPWSKRPLARLSTRITPFKTRSSVSFSKENLKMKKGSMKI